MLNEIITALKQGSYELKGDSGVEITGIKYDSRNVIKGDMFFALKGQHADGVKFVDAALKAGAAAIAVENGVNISAKVPVLSVRDAKSALARCAARFYGEPSKKMKLVGVTGTNGKTTITYLMESIFGAAALSSGVIGTVNYRYAGNVIDAPHTTPLAVELQWLLSNMAQSGVSHCVMEVSSHAVEERRVEACAFVAKIFTNLTPEHLDYHKNMDEYFIAKAKLFIAEESFGKGSAVINIDDEWGKKLAVMVKGAITYSIEAKGASIRPRSYSVSSSGIKAEVESPWGNFRVDTVMTGEHNLYNIMAAAGAAFSLGISARNIEAGIRNLKNVPGRLERVSPESGVWAYVDYGHTSDALERTLKVLRKLTDERGKRLVTVFGCGGNRDRTKRPRMGKAAIELSDFTIVTSDNPRDEDPGDIIAEVETGMTGAKKFSSAPQGPEKGYMAVVDRKEALKAAVMLITDGDTLLVAGKGHEDYQIVKGVKHHFDDREELRAILGSRKRC